MNSYSHTDTKFKQHLTTLLLNLSSLRMQNRVRFTVLSVYRYIHIAILALIAILADQIMKALGSDVRLFFVEVNLYRYVFEFLMHIYSFQ
jgi:hypothetical protein